MTKIEGENFGVASADSGSIYSLGDLDNALGIARESRGALFPIKMDADQRWTLITLEEEEAYRGGSIYPKTTIIRLDDEGD